MKFVEIPFPQIADAIAAGDRRRLSRGTFISQAKQRNLARFLVAGDDAIRRSIWPARGTRWAWAKAHPDVVARFASAITEAGKWANANPQKVVPIIANHLKSTGRRGASPRTNFEDKLVTAQIQPWIDITRGTRNFRASQRRKSSTRRVCPRN